MKNKIIWLSVLILIVAVGFAYWFWDSFWIKICCAPPPGEEKAVVFNCKDSKSINALFYLYADKNVELSLSDGRKFSLPRAISASGARYANSDESFVFWNKGDTAFITENGSTTYVDCVLAGEKSDSGEPIGTASYTNDEHGFEINFPSNIVPEYEFKQYYMISTNWRAEASEGSTGEALLSIPVFRIDQGGVATGKPYPLYFDAEVRIGVSTSPTEVANCYKPDPGYENQKISDVEINGIAFKKIDFGGVGMMQYIQGESYRVVRNNACLAFEQIKTGSSYRDETMLPGIPDEQLNAYYQQTGDIIQTLRFKK